MLSIWGVTMSEDKKNKKMLQVLEFLNRWERKIAEHLYGLNGKEKLTKSQVMKKFMVDKDEIVRLQNKIEDIKENELIEYGYYVEAVDEKTAKLIDRMSTIFFDMFKGVDPLVVEESLKIIPSKNRKIVFLFYGLDGIHCKDYDEIAEEFNISIDEVDEILEDCISKLKNHFKNSNNRYKKDTSEKCIKFNKYEELIKRYGEEKVEEAFRVLNKLDQNIIKDYYSDEDITFKYIAKKYNVSYAYAYNHIKEGMKEVEDVLIDPQKLSKKAFEMSYKYKKLIEKHGEDNVYKVFKELKEKNKLIVEAYYGINCDSLSVTEISKKYNVYPTQINILINNVRNRLNNKINKKSLEESKQSEKKKETGRKKENKYLNLVEKYGTDKVEKAFSMLREKEQLVLNLYYRSDRKLSLGDVSNETNIPRPTVVAIVSKGTKKIADIIENDFSLTKTKKISEKNKYGELINKYGEDKVEKAFSMLKEKEQKIINLYYKSDEDLSIVDVSKITNIPYSSTALLVNKGLKKIESLIVGGFSLKKTRKTRIAKKVNKYNELVIKYGEDKVEDAFKKLNDKERKVIELYYKIVNPMSLKEISNNLNVSVPTISSVVTRSLNKLVKTIENSDFKNNEVKVKKQKKTERKTKVNKYNELVDKYGEESVEKAFSMLREKEQLVLNLYYRSGKKLTIDNVASETNIPRPTVAGIVSKGTKKIADIIEKDFSFDKTHKISGKKRENKYDTLVEKYGKEKVEEAFEKLDDRTQKVIELYYKNNEEITINKISDVIGLSAPGARNIVNRGIDKIVSYIENPSLEIKKITKTNVYKDFVSKYGEDKVEIAFNLLNEKEKKVINLRYREDNLTIKEVGEKTGISKSTIFCIIDRAIKKLEKLIENPNWKKERKPRKRNKTTKRNKKNKYLELIQLYGEEKVEIAFDKLKEEEKTVLNLYYKANENLTMNEISERTGYTCVKLEYYRQTALKNIVEYIENPQSKAIKEKNDFYSIFEGYSKE